MARVFVDMLACVDGLGEGSRKDWEERERLIMDLQQLVRSSAELGDLPRDLVVQVRRAIEVQIKDLRSAIVREACQLLTVCCDVLGSHFSKSVGGLLPTLLEVLASGNKVIVSYVEQVCTHVFRTLRVPGAIPRLLQVLGESKNKEIRESCIGFLVIAFRHWGRRALRRHMLAIEDGLLSLLRDASSKVRARARDCFVLFHRHFPKEGAMLLNRTDDRTQRALRKEVANAEHEDMDVLETKSRDEDDGHWRSRRSSTTSTASNFSTASSYLGVDEDELTCHSGQAGHDTVSRPVGHAPAAPIKQLNLSEDEDFAEAPAGPEPPVPEDASLLPPLPPQIWSSASQAAKAGVVFEPPPGPPPMPPSQAPPLPMPAPQSHAEARQEVSEERPPLQSAERLARIADAHRVFLDKRVRGLAQELEMLRQFEALVASGRPTRSFEGEYVAGIKATLEQRDADVDRLLASLRQ